jgi:hypothetical protein
MDRIIIIVISIIIIMMIIIIISIIIIIIISIIIRISIRIRISISISIGISIGIFMMNTDAEHCHSKTRQEATAYLGDDLPLRVHPFKAVAGQLGRIQRHGVSLLIAPVLPVGRQQMLVVKVTVFCLCLRPFSLKLEQRPALVLVRFHNTCRDPYHQPSSGVGEQGMHAFSKVMPNRKLDAKQCCGCGWRSWDIAKYNKNIGTSQSPLISWSAPSSPSTPALYYYNIII